MSSDTVETSQVVAARRTPAEFQFLKLPSDVFDRWEHLNAPEGAAGKVKNSTEIVDLRSEMAGDDGQLLTVAKMKTKFRDRGIKQEIVWKLDNVRLKSMVLHGEFGRVPYYSRAAPSIEAKLAENPNLYRWTRGDDQHAQRFGGTTAMIDAPGASGNYYHWSMEVMPRLVALLPYLRNGTIDRIAFWAKPAKGFQNQYFQLLVEEELRDKLISLEGKPTIFERLVFFETRAIETRVTNLTVDFCRTVRALVDSSQSSDKVYVLRKPGNFRRLLQEEVLTDRLRGNGFSMIEGGDLSLQQQIAAFGRAERVVGVHGAGLTNLAFADPTATFIELTSRTYHRRVTYSDLALALGMNVKVVLLDQQGEYKSNLDCPDLTCSSPDALERLYELLRG